MTGSGWAAVALFLVSAYGWGRLARSLHDPRLTRLHSLSVVLGLALLNAIGGFLNFFHCATSVMLLVLLLAGAVLAVTDVLRHPPWRNVGLPDANQATSRDVPRTGRVMVFVPAWLALVGGVGACVLLVPTTLFNAGDDFHTYIPRPVRMIQ